VYRSSFRGTGFRGTGFRGAAASLPLLAALAMLAGPTGLLSTAQASTAQASTATGGSVTPLVLINGSVIHTAASPRGLHLASAYPAGSGLAGSLVTLRLAGGTYVLPAAALPYLGRGLDPSLFNLASLRNAESGGQLPVQIRFTGSAPSLPGVTITHTAAGSAQGYLTATSAKTFGAALAHQFVTDHGAGDYGSAGLFANGVTIGLAGAPLAARTAAAPGAARANRTGPPRLTMHTLTVNGSDLRGKPDTGDVVMVINVDNPIRFSDPIASLSFFFHGQTRFSVPAGHYWAIGDFFNFTATSANERLVVLPQFTVGSAAGAASNTVSVPETAASSLVSAITPRPTSPLLSMLDLRRTGPGGPMTAGWENVGLPLWISPTHHRPSVGTLQVFTDLEQRSPAHTAMPPYEYDVAFAATHGIIPSQRHVVSNAHLATVSEAYYQAVKSNGGFVRFGLFPQQFNDLLLLLINPLSLPRHDTEYYSAAPGLVWYSQYWQSGFNLSGGQSQAPEEYVGGQQLTDNWDAYPLHPAPNVRLRAPAGISTLPSASRQGNTLTLDITPFSDNQPGHLGAGFFSGFGSFPKLSGTYEIDQNGVKIAGGDAVAASGGAPDLLTQVHLDSHPSVIRFVLDATRKGKGNTYPLSTSSQTVWTWHSARDTHSTVPAGWECGSLLTGSPSRHCVVQPMMTLGYQVAGLSLAGKAKPGSQSLDLFAGHLQAATQAAITSAQVQVSFDDGATWQPASVTPAGAGHYQATFTAPPSSFVTLRVTAQDAAGGEITETILRGYQTSA